MIYLDHHAAAPTTPAVRQAMLEAAPLAWANPSSTHAAGRASKHLLEEARRGIAQAMGASAADLVLTAGGTEACNLGIRGLAAGRSRLLSSTIEHPAVEQTCRHLAAEGRALIRLPVPEGRPPSPEELERHLDDQTLLAMHWLNHETGTLFPIEQYARACQAKGARFFVDATQAFGKLPLDVSSLGADAVAVAAQKIGGPAGAGACWLRRGLKIEPLLYGGSQERGRRPGTPDTLSMVGFGAACGTVEARVRAQPRITELRNRIERELLALGATMNGGATRSGTVSNLSFAGWNGALLVAALDLEAVCVSTGAACSSGLQEPSAVLRAMYPDEQWRAGSAVRISLGIETTEEDIGTALRAFQRVLARDEA